MNRNRTSILAVVLIHALSGCINLPGIDPGTPDVPDGGTPPPDAGVADLSVRLLAPMGTAYTNGAVDVSVEVANGVPEAVELLAGDELLATLTAPYTYRWDTTSKPEGSYTLTARARRGAQTFTSEARTVVVDRTPPQVVSRTPAPGAQAVSVRAPIQVTFSEPLEPASLSDATVRLSMRVAADSIELAKALSLSVDGTVLTIAPNSKPAVPSELFASMESVTDRAGNPLLGPPDTWSWMHPAWLPVGGPLSGLPDEGTILTSSPAESPTLALDAQGNPVVAWREQPQGGSVQEGKVFVRRWTGASWESVGGSIPEMSTVSLAEPPSLEIDALGRPVVAWNNTGSNHVLVMRWEQGGWQEAGRLSNGFMTAGVSSAKLQFDGAGNAVVAWTQADGGPGGFPPPSSNVYVGRWTGTQWEVVGELSANPANETSASKPSLGTTSTGELVVAWGESDGVTQSIFVMRLTGEGWTPVGSALSARPGATSAGMPSLRLDPAGNPLVAWKESEEGGSSSNVYVQRWTGEQWEPLGNGVNSVPGIVHAHDPALAVDGEGTPIVAWAGTDGSTTNIYVHQWRAGRWEPLGGGLSANPEATSAAHPSLRVDAEGVPIVAWDESDVPLVDKQTRHVYVYRLNR
jgi:hypothetical protein